MSKQEDEAREIDGEVFRLVREILKRKNAAFIAKENEFHYSHGETWVHVDAESGKRNEGTFTEQSAESAISVARFLNNDASVIPEFVSDLSEKMHGTFARSVYGVVGEAAESVGNTVTYGAPDGLTEEEEGREIRKQLGDLFDRVELSVDRFGAPSYPQLHIHPNNKKLINALLLPETEDEQRASYEGLRREEADAVGREAARLARYARRS